MIDIHDVSKRFGHVVALDDVSVSVREGEALALWGSNGAGKTTLIRCILGVIDFDGVIRIGDVDVRRAGKRARSLVGYVPQELAFHDDTRLDAAMSFFARLRNVGAAATPRSLEAAGLGGHEDKRLRDLSGGMKQRLALAIALLSDPPIIVLDEPTSNLDAAGRRTVVDMLVRLRKSGKTLVFASHRAEEVATLADRVLVLENGRADRITTPQQMWSLTSDVRLVRLHVADGEEKTAFDLLREAGHAVELNGNGLCVATPPDRKGGPIAILSRASITVHDFDVLDVEPATEEGP